MSAAGYLRTVVVKFNRGNIISDAAANDRYYARTVIEHQFR